MEKPDGARLQLQVSPTDSVAHIKRQIEDKAVPAIPAAAQQLRLASDGTRLADDAAPISRYGVAE